MSKATKIRIKVRMRMKAWRISVQPDLNLRISRHHPKRKKIQRGNNLRLRLRRPVLVWARKSPSRLGPRHRHRHRLQRLSSRRRDSESHRRRILRLRWTKMWGHLFLILAAAAQPWRDNKKRGMHKNDINIRRVVLVIAAVLPHHYLPSESLLTSSNSPNPRPNNSKSKDRR